MKHTMNIIHHNTLNLYRKDIHIERLLEERLEVRKGESFFGGRKKGVPEGDEGGEERVSLKVLEEVLELWGGEGC